MSNKNQKKQKSTKLPQLNVDKLAKAVAKRIGNRSGAPKQTAAAAEARRRKEQSRRDKLHAMRGARVDSGGPSRSRVGKVRSVAHKNLTHPHDLNLAHRAMAGFTHHAPEPVWNSGDTPSEGVLGFQMSASNATDLAPADSTKIAAMYGVICPYIAKGVLMHFTADHVADIVHLNSASITNNLTSVTCPTSGAGSCLWFLPGLRGKTLTHTVSGTDDHESMQHLGGMTKIRINIPYTGQVVVNYGSAATAPNFFNMQKRFAGDTDTQEASACFFQHAFANDSQVALKEGVERGWWDLECVTFHGPGTFTVLIGNGTSTRWVGVGSTDGTAVNTFANAVTTTQLLAKAVTGVFFMKCAQGETAHVVTEYVNKFASTIDPTSMHAMLAHKPTISNNTVADHATGLGWGHGASDEEAMAMFMKTTDSTSALQGIPPPSRFAAVLSKIKSTTKASDVVPIATSIDHPGPTAQGSGGSMASTDLLGTVIGEGKDLVHDVQEFKQAKTGKGKLMALWHGAKDSAMAGGTLASLFL